jgi:hypothetical protein
MTWALIVPEGPAGSIMERARKALIEQHTGKSPELINQIKAAATSLGRLAIVCVETPDDIVSCSVSGNTTLVSITVEAL